MRWCRSWWLHAEAIARFDALHRSWPDAIYGDENALVVYYDHLDRQLAVLTSEDGPFAACRGGDHAHEARVGPLGHVDPGPDFYREHARALEQARHATATRRASHPTASTPLAPSPPATKRGNRTAVKWAALAGIISGGMAMLLTLVLLVTVIGIPSSGRTGLPGVVCAPPGVDPTQLVAGFGADQVSNAGLIVAAGIEMGVPVRGRVIAVATAMQESTLLNYANTTVAESLTRPHEAAGADHDSVGLFQQRAAGWGPVATRMDPKAPHGCSTTGCCRFPGGRRCR
ncbi:DUF4913 domain-containing protein [Pseudonocardia sp. ICBG1293]|uniref:DUF4913 domain-containing protein n=1 Tax=Pseudonocardia sp. ICBG1293 TaxID=2844382 RepID=UPI001CD01CA3